MLWQFRDQVSPYFTFLLAPITPVLLLADVDYLLQLEEVQALQRVSGALEPFESPHQIPHRHLEKCAGWTA
jgi:hypothetical protein